MKSLLVWVMCVGGVAGVSPASALEPTTATAAKAWFSCPSDAREPAAWYVGPYKGYDNDLSGVDLSRDFQCAELFKGSRYPKGFVTVFGSSRIGEFHESASAATAASGARSALTEAQALVEFNRTYAEVRSFANAWTKTYGKHFPILTGAGPGLMEAASRGASEAGPSIGYTTYYAPPGPGDTLPHSDDPSFVRYKDASGKAVPITTDGLVFSSVSARETAMILHSAAAVIAPGGSGTEWEIFQILEMLKSGQLRPIPVYFVGERYHWTTLEKRVSDMVARGTVKPGAITLEFAQCPADLVNKLGYRLGLTTTSPPESAQACKAPAPYLKRALREFDLAL